MEPDGAVDCLIEDRARQQRGLIYFSPVGQDACHGNSGSVVRAVGNADFRLLRERCRGGQQARAVTSPLHRERTCHSTVLVTLLETAVNTAAHDLQPTANASL